MERSDTMKAIWNGAVLAESDDTIIVEGNHYFPPNSIKREYFREATSTPPVRGKGWRATTTSWWTVKSIRMPPGTILLQRMLPSKSQGMLHFGEGCR